MIVRTRILFWVSMRQRLKELRAEHLIDERWVCPVALQGDRAGLKGHGRREVIAVPAVMGIAAGVRRGANVVQRGPSRRSKTRPEPKKVGAAAALSRLAA